MSLLKLKKSSVLLFCFLLMVGMAQAQNASRILEGIVLDQQDSSPLPGVNLLVKGTVYGTVTDEEGRFSLQIPKGEVELIISYIGYSSLQLKVPAEQKRLELMLTPEDLSLQEVIVVSTGFSELPLSRTTGSFSGINQELVERRVSTNLIERLEDVTPGLIFNRDLSGTAPGESISIRGTATLLSNSQPLIVVDNLAYDGPLSGINPNDVESITVLKDAAAASIWGARAGNGVIVITTKRGSYEQPMQVSLTGNLSFQPKPDPLYYPTMAISSLVDKQMELYEEGYFNSLIGNRRNPVVAPLAELLYAFDQGDISQQELDAGISRYRRTDLRLDREKYLQRTAIQQQYALQLSGGAKRNTYQLSLGWDKNLNTGIASDLSRITFSLNQEWKFLKEKLQVQTGIYGIKADTYEGTPNVAGLFPYEGLADESGNPLEVYRDFSVRFKNSVADLVALPWSYVPLNEIGLSHTRSTRNELRLNLGLNYDFAESLSWTANYQYWNSQGAVRSLDPLSSYNARNLINSLTQVGEDGDLSFPVPMGSILDQRNSNGFSHSFRTRLNFNRTWADHRVDAFIGGELKDFQTENYGITSYGYDEDNGTSLPVDYLTRFVNLGTQRLQNIPFTEEFGGGINRFVSAFGNLGYSYKDRYLFNGSLRRDASNLFGVNTNQKSVPLWSAGLGWIASEEAFLKSDLISFLKLRLSYGYNGNTNSNVTAVTTATSYAGAQNLLTRLPYLSLRTPPNPELKWERIKILNTGLDFELWEGRIGGSIDYYQKQGLDLLAPIPLFISSGFSDATLNYASTRTKGWDLVINSRNLKGEFLWNTNFFLSLLQEKVTEVQNDPSATQLINYSPALPTPSVGKPLYSIYSFPFAGLDPADGAPLGLVDGEPSRDYGSIYSEATQETIQYHGSGRPTRFGAIRNTFSYKGWNLSANISYRLGYYFRRPSVNYDDLNRGELTHSDYENRWIKPGDEQSTNIPSDPGMVDAYRSQFYLSSAATVSKGDHIRFQDLRVSKSWDKAFGKGNRTGHLETYVYMNNLGILWKANKEVKDPDFLVQPSLFSFSMGFRARF
ncbi:SusC/RagA family TonB-linked outer membrane protein [Algoriphagus pacificus]|uniref:SusC/RagA family TonB-linked outer membrane protein n=1 Tax=Algoriphagus pacificus TaxID=2811234 RepID=A0ABS3CJI0_9BACT|nr:SusC/RagA family TonB-linked outer membrane protein [Algoriphagus pacificus]MBN7816915.1 SusC/RagA family TonB-linked outer membrane protein [Algoriphagus pacificus]